MCMFINPSVEDKAFKQYISQLFTTTKSKQSYANLAKINTILNFNGLRDVRKKISLS